MFYLEPPTRIKPRLYTTIPAIWTSLRPSEWAYHNQSGKEMGSFLEGPCYDSAGNLLVVDVPFGRIFRICQQTQWTLLAEYDGWPNGLKCTSEGRIFVADHRLGLVEIMGTGEALVLLSGYRGERFRGLNDITLGKDDWVYFTDQGQSGLQEPSGCVYRWHQTSEAIERILSHIPSPNGLVLSNNQERLFVAVTRANAVWRLPFVPDGSISKVGVFLNLSGGGGPDGITTDADGGLVVAQPGLGVLRFDARGMLTHYVELPHGSCPSNIAFKDCSSLQMVITDSATGNIYEVDMPFGGVRN